MRKILTLANFLSTMLMLLTRLPSTILACHCASEFGYNEAEETSQIRLAKYASGVN